MRIRELLLVAVLVLAGFVLFQFQTGRWDIGGDWSRGWPDGFGAFGREASAEETRTLEAPLPAAIEIENGRGRVEVRGADQEAVRLTFRKTAWRRTEEEAREIAGRLGYTVTKGADTLALAANRDEFARQGFETSFILTVPRGMSVRVGNSHGAVRVDGVAAAAVRNSHGEVFVTDVRGDCGIETSHEDVEVRRVAGECRVTNRHGDVRADSVGGDLRIETSYGGVGVEDCGGKADVRGPNVAVEARRVAGAVTVDTSYRKVHLADVGPAEVTSKHAAVTAEDVRGDLKVRTSYGPVQAARVRGRLIVGGANAAVTADGVGGDRIDVKTSYAKVSLAGFSAEVAVANRNGAVSLVPLDLRRGLSVRNEYGEVRLAWPDGETARVEAQARGGEVRDRKSVV